MAYTLLKAAGEGALTLPWTCLNNCGREEKPRVESVKKQAKVVLPRRGVGAGSKPNHGKGDCTQAETGGKDVQQERRPERGVKIYA